MHVSFLRRAFAVMYSEIVMRGLCLGVQFAQDDLCRLFYSCGHKFCALGFAFWGVFFFASCEDAAAGGAAGFFEIVVKFVCEGEAFCDFRVARGGSSEEVADHHGSACQGAADAAASSQVPRKAGAHGDCVIGEVQVEVFADGVDDGFGTGETLVEDVDGVFLDLVYVDICGHVVVSFFCGWVLCLL